jgi:hypothetical protein
MRPRNQDEERTSFQEAGEYHPEVDSHADVAMVYGLTPSFETRLARWRQAGYRIHVMTGVAWGDYADYVRGEWDGIPHFDDAQTETGNFRLEHGISQGHDIYYMVPSRAYANYLSGKLHRVVDAGALALHLEEPEFWTRAGYGLGFEREWQEYYNEPWQDPTSSPDARYRASKLMQHLYTRALNFLFADIKQYAREKGVTDFKCYVPTHSLINYSHWHIVSPESLLLTIPDCDGIIGQIWTGTSRTATVYRGLSRQRTFEAGYCEYAACAGMVRGTGKRLWQLADPIEDNPNYCWDDYRLNWECTVAGSLLVPESDSFEITPWPLRVFMRDYPTVNLDTLALKPLLDGYLARLHAANQLDLEAQTNRALELYMEYYRNRTGDETEDTIGFARLAEGSEELRFGDLWAGVNGFYKSLSAWPDQEDAQRVRSALSALYHNAAGERARIPADYATELQVVYNALADMAWPGETEWLAGHSGVALGIADSLMFQRGEPNGSDADMSSLYGLAMPLVKNGVSLSFAQLERAAEPGYLDPLRVLMLTYEGQKPPSASIHTALVDWVKRGNALVLLGNGDSYNQVREWWNQAGLSYASPQAHLTELAGIGLAPADGLYACGKGWIRIDGRSPSALAHDAEGPNHLVAVLQQIQAKLGGSFTPSHVLALRRGPYVTAAGMDESLDAQPYTLTGRWVNLFDASLPIITDPQIAPDTRWLFYDLSRLPAHAWVIASAGKVENEVCTESTLSFTVSGMQATMCSVRASLPGGNGPIQVDIDGLPAVFDWDPSSHTVLLRFPNAFGGVAVNLHW